MVLVLSLEVPILEDAVTAGQLHHLGVGGEHGVHLEAAQLEVGEAHLRVMTDEARSRTPGSRR